MPGREVISVFAVLVFSSLFPSASNALCILGMGSCNGGNGGIDGEYVRLNNPNTKLTIDASKIAASQGPMTIAADYTVRSVEGNQILIDVSAPGTPPGSATIIVDGQVLHIKGNFVFNGDWKRK
jgi:hypothetical protein